MQQQPMIGLSQVLDLVGRLDDSAGDSTARERFRQFLRQNLLEVGQVRDYIEECLRKSGDQYERALQDLVNYVGRFLGFDVRYGRYQGVQGQIGFDGHWQSPTGYHIVVEVKTTDVYVVKTDTLVGYIDKLISTERTIPSWDEALGLYVLGRLDAGANQLKNAIIAERRTQQLRIISVESLLSLAELVKIYGLGHDDVLSVIRPSAPTVDTAINLMTRLVAEKPPEAVQTDAKEQINSNPPQAVTPVAPAESVVATYWLTSVKDDDVDSAENVIRRLIGKEKAYAFGERTPGRKLLKKGDWICFHASGRGIVADAHVASPPDSKPLAGVRHPERYPWSFKLEDTRLYWEKPVIIDASLRSRLEAFDGKDPNGPWAWFVQATHKLSKHDFDLLTRRTGNNG